MWPWKRKPPEPPAPVWGRSGPPRFMVDNGGAILLCNHPSAFRQDAIIWDLRSGKQVTHWDPVTGEFWT